MDNFTFLDKTYTLSHKMTFGEVSRIRRLIKQIVETAKSVESEEAFQKLDVPQQVALIESSDSTNTEYEQIMANVLYRCLNLSQDDLNLLEFPDAVQLFGMVYSMSTNLKKKSSQQSESPSPTTT